MLSNWQTLFTDMDTIREVIMQMQCPRCHETRFDKVPYISEKTKGIMLRCECCDHVMYELQFKSPEDQERLNKAFHAKKAELESER